jgi:DeoR family transcriptional regulator of aga operon
LNRRMLDVAARTVALADASKLDRRSLARIAPVAELDCILTDTSAPADTVVRYRAAGIDVRLA